jgi:segregation and condensation protein A
MAETRLKGTSVEEKTQKQILDLIVGKDDVSWKNIIFGLIESEQMDPWDINISLISAKFLEQVKRLQEMDFRISGKVVLATAVLLKLKAERLRDEELEALDRIIHSAEEPVDLGLDELGFEEQPFANGERPQLIPRTPQPRKRKVSVYDLVEALEKALEADARRPEYIAPKTLDTIDPPEHHIDISVIIREVYDRIYGHYELEKSEEKLMFHHIARSTDPQDMVMTFIPLLHLENARKIDLEQPEHFGPINIYLLDKTPPAYGADGKERQTRLEAATNGIKEIVKQAQEAKPATKQKVKKIPAPKEFQIKLAKPEEKQKPAVKQKPEPGIKVRKAVQKKAPVKA